MDPVFLMISSDMQSFPTTIWGVCPSFFYLDPPISTGIVQASVYNRVIARNGQLFSLANQGNSGLKVF